MPNLPDDGKVKLLRLSRDPANLFSKWSGSARRSEICAREQSQTNPGAK